MDKIGTSIDTWDQNIYTKNSIDYEKYFAKYQSEQQSIKLGGGTLSIEKQHSKGRMTARERIDYLIDKKSSQNK